MKKLKNKSGVSIKNALYELFDPSVHSGFSFNPVSNGGVEIGVFEYIEDGIVEKCDLGEKYHIICYKVKHDGTIVHNDLFSAVLIDPRVYGSHLITCGFYGLIAKVTNTSFKSISETYKKILSIHEKKHTDNG